MCLASIFNLAGPDILILAIILAIFIPAVGAIIFVFVATFKRPRGNPSPPPARPDPPPPPNQS